MRASDLLLDFGRPVAYFPGLVKRLGSVNAVIFFSQIFYWQDKADSKLGVYKTSEEIESETGLSYREQLTARKHLVSRGILVETNKRLEHKIYYLIDCEKLDYVMSQPIENAPMRKAQLGKVTIVISRNNKTNDRDKTKLTVAMKQIRSSILQRLLHILLQIINPLLVQLLHNKTKMRVIDYLLLVTPRLLYSALKNGSGVLQMICYVLNGFPKE
ncbi:hypothetical protein [Proteus faecis]|uniref:hypothetical protein n=1 Tax=Proteus faecis TaxID=2050967 RepID=UPI00301BA1F3